MAPLNPVKGSKHYAAKLNEGDVKLILELVAERDDLLSRAKHLSYQRIAEKFAVCKKTIEKIASGKSWKHV